MEKAKMDEGIAVWKAVISGACDKCKYLHRCENDETFKFPKDAACMVNMYKSKN